MGGCQFGRVVVVIVIVIQFAMMLVAHHAYGHCHRGSCCHIDHEYYAAAEH